MDTEVIDNTHHPPPQPTPKVSRTVAGIAWLERLELEWSEEIYEQ